MIIGIADVIVAVTATATAVVLVLVCVTVVIIAIMVLSFSITASMTTAAPIEFSLPILDPSVTFRARALS